VVDRADIVDRNDHVRGREPSADRGLESDGRFRSGAYRRIRERHRRSLSLAGLYQRHVAVERQYYGGD